MKSLILTPSDSEEGQIFNINNSQTTDRNMPFAQKEKIFKFSHYF